MDYGFYIAKIVSVSQEKDNRLGVKVLPYMEGINNAKCPVWPSFFKDELYTGKEGDLVWVLCDNEFSMGYVFALANYNTYPDLIDKSNSTVFEKSSDNISLSIPKTLKDNISKSSVEVDGLYLNLNNVKVTYWDDNCIHYIERDTGNKIIAFNSGTLYMFKQNEFVVKIGKTILKLNQDSLGAVSKAINLQSDSVNLGNGKCKAKVLVTEGTSAEGAYVAEAVHA